MIFIFLSIICPCYNVEKYLETCVNSVATQNIDDFEMILIDDGSKDSTPAMCDELAQKFNFIKVIHKANGGVSSARNAGLKIAKGEKILFLDSDDLLFDGSLKAIQKIVGKNKEIRYFNFNYGIVNVDINTPIIHPASITEGIKLKNDFLREFFNHNSPNLPWAPWHNIYDLAHIKENNLSFNESLSVDEDYLFNFEYLRNVKEIYHSNINVIKYRSARPGSLTSNIKAKNVSNTLKNRAFMFNNCEEEMLDIFAALYMSIVMAD